MGAVSTLRLAGGRVGRRAHRARPPLPFLLVTALVLAVTLTGLGLATTYEVGSYRGVLESESGIAYGQQLVSAVAYVKAEARPNAAVVVAGLMAVDAWAYYQFEYTGLSTGSGPELPPKRVVLVVNHGSPAIARMIDAARPPEVFLYVPFGTDSPDLNLDVMAITASGGCRQVTRRDFALSGALLTFSCRP